VKLVIQIPCLNEQDSLPVTLAELPRQIAGVDVIEWLIIDDGSTDRTVEVARALGVDYVVRHPVNKGLAAAFRSGLDASLQLGADIIVNTDADNQYPARYIPDLIGPILRHEADIVIGDRQTGKIEHFSPTKRRLQSFGSAVVRWVSGTTVPDAPSGFRAISRNAALQLNILTRYTYTLETIIQAGSKNLVVTHVPIETNNKLRESRLIKSMGRYVLRSATTILWLFVLYRPLRSFSLLATPFVLSGGVLWLRFAVLSLLGEAGRGTNIQSVIVGSALLIIGFMVFLIGLIGELVAMNRRLQEETLFYVKRLALVQPDFHPTITRLEPTPKTETPDA
jgi:glycosyltransferase involved in cell wall biosynthesis